MHGKHFFFGMTTQLGLHKRVRNGVHRPKHRLRALRRDGSFKRIKHISKLMSREKSDIVFFFTKKRFYAIAGPISIHSFMSTLGNIPLLMACRRKVPVHERMALIAYASSECSDETAHKRSLVRAFAARIYKV